MMNTRIKTMLDKASSGRIIRMASAGDSHLTVMPAMIGTRMDSPTRPATASGLMPGKIQSEYGWHFMPGNIMSSPQRSPRAFQVMAKPTGAKCNLSCAYCFFLKKDALYPGSRFRMSDELMERYIRQTIEAHQAPEMVIAWQGGEPTLMGLDFFRRSVEIERKYKKPGVAIRNTLQTNGILLDDEWYEFLRENEFLVGVSLDGPGEMHDLYRKDRAGRPTFDRVMHAVRLLQKHKVDVNILCTVNAANGDRPLEVYRFFRDEARSEYLQFIPIVERVSERGFQEGCEVTGRSVGPEQYGRFLMRIFDEWVRRDVGRMFVQQFDGTLMSWLRGHSSLCIFRRTCGEGVALEHNGDVYSCDHFVEPGYLLGNIAEKPLVELSAPGRSAGSGSSRPIWPGSAANASCVSPAMATARSTGS